MRKETNMEKRTLPSAEELMKLVLSNWISKPIFVAAKLGIADLLADGPKDIADLARSSHAHAPTLYRVMRALASIGIFSEVDRGRFGLTPLAEELKTGAMRSSVLLFHSAWSDEAWGCLLESVLTGGTAFAIAHGKPLSDWLETNPDAAQIFNEANAKRATSSCHAVLDACDFTGIETLTDVGGGLGVLLAEILVAHPGMHGILAETPGVLPAARRAMEARGIQDRCRFVECDFFQEIPGGSDAYLLSNILHDWSDERCRAILDHCRRAMTRDSRLLIVEMIVPPGNAFSPAKLMDLEMLVTTGGRERTEEEFRALLACSGFDLVEINPTPEGVFVLEARIPRR